MSTDNINVSPESQLDSNNLDYENSYKPWATVVRGRCTCTANLFQIQKELIDNKQQAITRDDIAEALHKRKLLRQTKVIRLSSNIMYASIQFDTSMIMETFCKNSLLIREQFSVTFLLDFRKKQRQYYELEYITFQNIPTEADEEGMTDYVKQFATVVERPRHPTKTLGETEYLTGTRVYRVHSRKEHLPRFITLFGRKIKPMYTAQPEYQDFQAKKAEQERQRKRDLERELYTDTDGNTEPRSDTDGNREDTDPQKVTINWTNQ